jgi:chemotaxis protein methyltransferase CheR
MGRQDPRPAPELGELEIDLLLEGMYRHSGVDFRGYSRTSLRRRVWNAVRAEGLTTITGLLDRVLHSPEALDRLVQRLPVTVTSMFRDPPFWVALREQVLPHLRAAPFVRVWCAGCATGEEAYSLAILLAEEGLYERSRIYATDLSAATVERARSGIFPLDQMQEFTAHYVAAGGRHPFSRYYTADSSNAIFRHALKRNLVFAQHNLAQDASFNEFNLILCRNVLIYFSRELQARVHALLHQSLRRLGILALGRREALKEAIHEQQYEVLDERERLFRRRS